MAVPDYPTLMLPILRFLGVHSTREVRTKEVNGAMATEFKLTEAEWNQTGAGRQSLLGIRGNWARINLKIAGLIETPRSGFVRISQRGLDVLARNPARIDYAFLAQFPEVVAYYSQRARRAVATRQDRTAELDPTETKTPLENLEAGHQRLREELANELLERIKQCSPAFFERLVVELFVKMGYGGSRADAGRAIGRSGDGGIDGIIKEDWFGLDTIYTQAKRWSDKPVSRPDVQQFQGALSGHGAVKGIFITTSHFTKEALDYAAGLRNCKIVLIDGDELAELMIDHGIGVATLATYEVKRLDSDYFIEDE